jgi:hypothetical protein
MTAAAMEPVVTGDFANYEVHFLNSDDPRHGFTVMSMNPPTYYEFQTPIGFRETHTMVRVAPHSLTLFLFPLKRPVTDKLTFCSWFCTQLDDRRRRRDHSNIQLVRTKRSGNNDVARSSFPPESHVRACYASSIDARVSKNTTQLLPLYPSPFHRARSCVVRMDLFCSLTHLLFFSVFSLYRPLTLFKFVCDAWHPRLLSAPVLFYASAAPAHSSVGAQITSCVVSGGAAAKGAITM